MNEQQYTELEIFFRDGLEKILTDKPIGELRKLDWFSLNADFYIEQDRQKKAA